MSSSGKVWLLIAGLALPGLPARAADPEPVRVADVLRGLGRLADTEFGRMFVSILKSGADMGPGRAWFGPSQSRYTWKWLAARCDKDNDGRITAKEFNGPPELFARLDRDGDGVIRSGDLDWGPFAMARYGPAFGLFSMIDGDINGKVSRAEWERLFQYLAKGKDHLIPEDLMDLLSPPRPPAQATKPTQPAPPMGPSRWTLLKGLLGGELGSPFPGPALGDPAPPFTLPTVDGTKEISLESFRLDRPVVLIFGSFT